MFVGLQRYRFLIKTVYVCWKFFVWGSNIFSILVKNLLESWWIGNKGVYLQLKLVGGLMAAH